MAQLFGALLSAPRKHSLIARNSFSHALCSIPSIGSATQVPYCLASALHSVKLCTIRFTKRFLSGAILAGGITGFQGDDGRGSEPPFRETPTFLKTWRFSRDEIIRHHVLEVLVFSTMTQPSVTIVWHKCTDLRLHDNECLSLAHSDGLPVLHIFVFDPLWWRPLPLTGLVKTGPIRTRFLLECLEDLRESLAAHGQRLFCLRGPTARVFARITELVRVTKCYAFTEVCSQEQRIEREVGRILSGTGASLELRWGFTLYHIDDLTFDPWRAHSYRTYSAFRRPVQEESTVRAEVAPPRMWQPPPSGFALGDDAPALDGGALPTVAELCGCDAPRADDRAPVYWVGGER